MFHPSYQNGGNILSIEKPPVNCYIRNISRTVRFIFVLKTLERLWSYKIRVLKFEEFWTTCKEIVIYTDNSRKKSVEQSKEISKIWQDQKTFDICSYIIFGWYDQSFVSGTENRTYSHGENIWDKF